MQAAWALVNDTPKNGATVCCTEAPLERSSRYQLPPLAVDCCRPRKDDETRMQSNASAELATASAATTVTSNKRTRCFMSFLSPFDRLEPHPVRPFPVNDSRGESVCKT